jgi:hypothetical protein
MIQAVAALREGKDPWLEVSVCQDPLNGDRFTVAVEIDAPAEEVYALLDWADARNKWRQMGDSVTALDGDGQRFRLVISFMQDVCFDYRVEEAIKPHVYACACVPTPPVGHLERSFERYRIEPVDDARCAVTYAMTAHFEAGLNARQSTEVMRNMTVACHNALAKLKAEAEHGVGTFEAFCAARLMPI